MNRHASIIRLAFLICICNACIALCAEPATQPQPQTVTAIKAGDFLDSIGACVHIQHHQDAAKLIDPIRYTGIRAIRDGADGNYDMTGLLLLHKETGMKVCFGPGSGAKEASLQKTLSSCRTLAAAGALLAIEGPNEPNNFGGVTYEGKNSNKLKSWLPVAHYQRDFYAAAKADAELKKFPVYGVSEAGAEDDNAGMQFLTIPAGANTLMPDGTVFCDFLNCHNYVCGNDKVSATTRRRWPPACGPGCRSITCSATTVKRGGKNSTATPNSSWKRCPR